MLTKETKQQAERIGAELAPISEKIKKLAAILKKASNETAQAHKVAIAWQYPTVKGYSDDACEDWESIKTTRENNPKEWARILDIKYKELSEKETAEKCACLNYHNFLLYYCSVLAHLLRVGDTWASFYEKKGIETLAEYLRETQSISLYILRDGTGWECFGSNNFYCYFNIIVYGVCSISGNNWGTYRPHQEGEENATTKPNAPKVYTVAQYCQIVAKLSKLESEAQAKAREHYVTACSSGLVYFVGGLETPRRKVWKMRE